MSSGDRKLVRVLDGGVEKTPPVWLMRQAGRYLPEYRAVRERAGSFWGMALNPELAAEVTIQPIRRFGFDAAILFSDILTVPEALGQPVTFTAGEGPSMTPVTSTGGFNEDRDSWARYFEPVYEALRRTRAGLDGEGFAATTLLGFAGAPWTLATYLAAGVGGDEQKAAKLWAYRDPQGFATLLDILGECVAFHLIRQLQAGADAVQIFDSWAGGVPPSLYDAVVVQPARKIVAQVRDAVPGARIIGFPRAVTQSGYEQYVANVPVNAVSIDTGTPMAWAKNLKCAVQGNLDPIALIAGGAALDRCVDTILEAAAGKPHIFNLGHGILPETPIAHVEQLLKRIRGVKIAVVLFNLGGPDLPEAVEPFLRNLFSDPAIISLPAIVRLPLARLIARRRAPVAKKIYEHIGGRSPIFEETRKQADALAAALCADGPEAKCFVAMRCWHPFSDGAARAVKAFDPDKIVLLPLYPQFSTATTASSLKDWVRAAKKVKLEKPTSSICCYPDEAGFVEAAAAHIRKTMTGAPDDTSYRLLLSAHGLPRRTIARGDPYQWQVERSAAAIVAKLAMPQLEPVVCYQSRVGPLEWIGPSTDAEIRRAGADGKGVVVFPVAFVSEHSETLVELDIEYAKLAQESGVKDYRRAPTVGAEPSFIGGLATLVRQAAASSDITSSTGSRICPQQFCRCAMEKR